ncbi:MAG TPA: VWA domain-containing protein [Bryobacteraceae bacterium]|jgi:VWFA-related protein|nr:VWA domain-containing protein [Bryobacteraceae bacterium]
MRLQKAWALIPVVILTAWAQQPAPPKPAAPPQPAQDNAAGGDNFTISSNTQLVIETVTARDKSGKNIEGLTAKDFTVTEDGAPQTIKFFDFEKLPDVPEPLPPQTGDIKVLNKFPKTQIAAETPGSELYKDHRLLALYFDMTALPPGDQLRALDAARKFIRTQMTSADLMAIMLFQGGAVNVLQDFTADRDRLSTIVETISVGESQGFDETTNDAAAADTGAAFGQDDSEFNIFNTDRQLAALQTAAVMLGHLSEKKALLYFASGIRLNGMDNQAQLHATVNAAIRSGVSFWPIDARGLVASAPLGDATRGSPGGNSMYSGTGAMTFNNNFQSSQDTLWALAGDTGGKALLDNNDLAAGIVQAQKSVASYYIVGYYTSNQTLDGKFRRVKITLNNGVSASLDFRQGYFAGKTFNKFTLADKERQLEDALMLGDPITDLTIAMEVNYFQLNRAEYYVPVEVKIPGRELALARKRGADHTVIDFILEVKDDFGSTIQNIRDKVDAKLTDKTAAELAKVPIEYSTGFTLLPGKYVVKFLARDAETGRIGTYINAFTIPNLNKEEKRIPISSVVLSSQRVDMRESLFNAAKGKAAAAADAVDPMITDGQRLMPSVTRVFSKSRDMYVFLQAYERGAATTQPLAAFVTFYRGQTKAFETSPVVMTDGMDAKSKAVPLRFDLALDKLQPGEYNCQVTVLDTNGQKAAFWQAPVMLVP